MAAWHIVFSYPNSPFPAIFSFLVWFIGTDYCATHSFILHNSEGKMSLYPQSLMTMTRQSPYGDADLSTFLAPATGRRPEHRFFFRYHSRFYKLIINKVFCFPTKYSFSAASGSSEILRRSYHSADPLLSVV